MIKKILKYKQTKTKKVHEVLMKYWKEYVSDNSKDIQKYISYIDENNYHIEMYYTNQSVSRLIEFMNRLKLKKDLVGLLVISKRINEDTIEINFRNTEYKIYMINVFNNNFQYFHNIFKQKYDILLLHNLMHYLSFPYEEMVNCHKIYEILKHFSINNIFNLKKEHTLDTRTTDFSKKILKRLVTLGYNKNTIILNYNNPMKHIDLIYISKKRNDFIDMIKNTISGMKVSYVQKKSSHRFSGIYADIVSANKKISIFRIYSGERFCYPYIQSGKYMFGSESLVLKYFFLDLFFKRSRKLKPGHIKHIKKNIGSLLEKSVNEKCSGQYISSRFKYLKKNLVQYGKMSIWTYVTRVT